MKLENPQQVKHFRKRRARLAKQVESGIVVLPTAPERSRNADTHYDYRWDSGFYYLTGFREPEAVLVMVANGGDARTILFCREKNVEREIWDGFRFGPSSHARLSASTRRTRTQSSTSACPSSWRTRMCCTRPWEAIRPGTCASRAG